MKILYVTTVGMTMGFFESFFSELQKHGHTVDIACGDLDSLPEFCKKKRFRIFPLSCSRSPFDKGNIRAVRELRYIVRKNKYDIVHCHTPVAAACTRLACRPLRKQGLKVFYTAHGFHFYTGAPFKNWLIYYPVEKWLSRYTDVLITINKEDYSRAKKEFNAKKIEYVPGVGIDTSKFSPTQSGRKRIREELELDDSQTMLLSVGELNENKNHIAVIKAIKGMKNLVYVIVGKGDLGDELIDAAEENGVDLRLTGFRNDVVDFYAAADVYVLPSIREGLNVSLMEAMASGLPVICGNIRGNTDLIDDKDCLFEPMDCMGIRSSIKCAIKRKETLGDRNLKKIRSFDFEVVERLLFKIYGE